MVAENPQTQESRVIEKFLSWSKEKSQKFDADDVRHALTQLEADGLIRNTLLGCEPIAPRVA